MTYCQGLAHPGHLGKDHPVSPCWNQSLYHPDERLRRAHSETNRKNDIQQKKKLCNKSYRWAEVLVIFLKLVHELQMFLFLFQLGDALLALLQPLLSSCKLIPQPLVLLTQSPHLNGTKPRSFSA